MDNTSPLIGFLAVDSTNKVAHVYAKAGVPSGFSVSAKLQTNGYGSRGRNWDSPLGNLYMSTIWQQDILLDTSPTMMVMVTTLSIFDTLQTIGVEEDIRIKWPNDILIAGKKISGILIEHILEGDSSAYAVIGIGINLFTAPKKTERPAICLYEVCTHLPSTESIINDILGKMRTYFDLLQDQPEKLIERYKQHLYKKGERIVIQLGTTSIVGMILDIDKDGALIIKTDKGIEKIYSGDIITA